MTDRERKLLSRQLSDQARLLESQAGGELAVSLTVACCELLKTVRGIDPGGDFEEVYYGYIQLSEEIEAFFSGAEEKLESERHTEEYVQVQERLKTARAGSEEARTARIRAEAALSELREQTDRERRKQEEIQEELAQLKENYATFLDMMKDCSTEKIEEQKRKNDELIAVYQQSREALGQLEEDQKEQEEKNRSVIRKIKALESIIAQMPDHRKELVRTYQEKEAYLALLRQAETACSPERQAEMQREIDCLQPVTDRLRQDTETLERCLAGLREQSTQYDAKRHTLATNVLELWKQAIADLRKTSAEYEKAIAEIDAEAQDLAQHLADCEAVRRRYGSWLDADTTPLQAMMSAVGRPESEKLRETLDPGSMDRVKRLTGQIQGDLKELDKILLQCSSAIKTDQRTLERRALR